MSEIEQRKRDLQYKERLATELLRRKWNSLQPSEYVGDLISQSPLITADSFKWIAKKGSLSLLASSYSLVNGLARFFSR